MGSIDGVTIDGVNMATTTSVIATCSDKVIDTGSIIDKTLLPVNLLLVILLLVVLEVI